MMTRAQADECVPRLVRLRRACWSAIVNHDPMFEVVCGLAVESMHATNGSLASLCAMYRQLGGDRHEVAATHLIAAISESDTDDQWLDRVIADLVSLHSDVHDGLAVRIGLAGAEAPGFAAYLTAVRAAYFVLCLEKQRGS